MRVSVPYIYEKLVSGHVPVRKCVRRKMTIFYFSRRLDILFATVARKAIVASVPVRRAFPHSNYVFIRTRAKSLQFSYVRSEYCKAFCSVKVAVQLIDQHDGGRTFVDISRAK